MIRVRRGLDLPVAGEPRQEVERAQSVRSVAVLGPDYPGLKPRMLVEEGDQVRRGQALFEDRQLDGVRFTAPAGGRVRAINRGQRRVLLSVVIDVAGGEDETFPAYGSASLAGLGREKVQQLLLESGEWAAIRTRPFGKVPAAGSAPGAIFVPAMDTSPLAADPDVIIGEQLQAFRDGLTVLSRLTDGPVWVCRSPDSRLPPFADGPIREEAFSGPHPAGNPGTHIHFLYPVDRKRVAWVVGYQDVIAIGRLFVSGQLYTDRIVALAGPQVRNPRLLRTRVGASLDDLVEDEIEPGKNRVVSGSVLHGHRAEGAMAYLGRLSNQVTVLREGHERQLLGYLSPGLNRHSALNIYLSRLMPWKRFAFTTSTNGSERAMVPLGQYEQVMPLDILATQLLRAIVVGDIETAENLGALELVEEDLALCTYVCAGKYDYGPILRDNLKRLEEEG